MLSCASSAEEEQSATPEVLGVKITRQGNGTVLRGGTIFGNVVFADTIQSHQIVN